MTTEHEFEPKTLTRFVVQFPLELDIPYWTVQRITKPKYSNGEWLNIRIDFIDSTKHSPCNGIFKLITGTGTPELARRDKVHFSIKSLDKLGTEVEEWVVYIESIVMVDFGNLDYTKDSDEILLPYMIIKPYKCILK